MDKPSKVYKFLDMKNIDRLQQVIEDSRLYFAKPSQFNDPFEFKPKRLSIDTTGLDYGLVKQYLDPNADSSHELICKVLDNFGVCCFSAKRDDILMWSHYGESHQGVCVGFDTSHDFFKILHPVDYQPERHELDNGNPNEIIFKVMLRKFETWSYEEEWRLLRRPGAEIVQFPEDSLVDVIFGAFCSEPRERLVRKLLHGRNINFFKAEIDKYDFKLNVLPC